MIVKDVKVRNFKTSSDREIERKIKLYISNILPQQKKSITINVKKKVVTLIGALRDPHELMEIVKFIKEQPSVQAIEKKVKLKSSLVKKNIFLAKKLEERVKNLFHGIKHINIQIFGNYAEVSGVIKIASNSPLIENYLLQSLPVKRVINKLYCSK